MSTNRNNSLLRSRVRIITYVVQSMGTFSVDPPDQGYRDVCFLHISFGQKLSLVFFSIWRRSEVIISSFRGSALSAIRALSSSLPIHRNVLISERTSFRF